MRAHSRLLLLTKEKSPPRKDSAYAKKAAIYYARTITDCAD